MRRYNIASPHCLLVVFSMLLFRQGFSGDAASFPITPLQREILQGFIGFDGAIIDEKIILDFQSQHKTCAWHWLPMQETKPGGDPINNLYAVGGYLDKLDKVTGGSARHYEYDHNRKAKDAGKQYAWWGHCNNAAEATCILSEPTKGVVMRAKSSASLTPLQEQLMEGFIGFEGELKFSKNDIQGLLLLMSSSLVGRIDCMGERNDFTDDDPCGLSRPSNPMIDAKVIYDIYMESLN